MKIRGPMTAIFIQNTILPGLGRLMLWLFTVAGFSPSGTEPGEKAATEGRVEASVKNLLPPEISDTGPIFLPPGVQLWPA
jgi:hypothetical protein